MRHRYSISIPISFFCALLWPLLAAAQIRMTPCAPEVTEAAKNRVATAFKSLDTLQSSNLTADLVVIGPRLWAKVRRDLENAPERGASVFALVDERFGRESGIPAMDLSKLPEKDRRIYEAMLKADKNRYVAAEGAMKHGAPTLMRLLGEMFAPGTPVKIREANHDELLYYWGIVAYDLKAPILTVETSAGWFLFDMGLDDDGLSVIELLPSTPEN